MLKRIAALLWLLALAGCAAPVAEYRPAQYSGYWYYYDPTSGSVGYHMTITRYRMREDKRLPNEKGCQVGAIETAGIAGAQCFRDLIVRGSLPPGLDFESCYSHTIIGAPTAPGVWEVVIRQPELYCAGGTTPPKDVTVRIQIEGTAPRGVR